MVSVVLTTREIARHTCGPGSPTTTHGRRPFLKSRRRSSDKRHGRFSVTGGARVPEVSSGVDSRRGLVRVADGSCLLPIAAGSALFSLLESGSRHGIASSACPCQRDRRLVDAH